VRALATPILHDTYHGFVLSISRRVSRPHGGSGVVKAKFRSNLPPHAFGASVRVVSAHVLLDSIRSDHLSSLDALPVQHLIGHVYHFPAFLLMHMSVVLAKHDMHPAPIHQSPPPPLSVHNTKCNLRCHRSGPAPVFSFRLGGASFAASVQPVTLSEVVGRGDICELLSVTILMDVIVSNGSLFHYICPFKESNPYRSIVRADTASTRKMMEFRAIANVRIHQSPKAGYAK
jgi:hypothetical protein